MHDQTEQPQITPIPGWACAAIGAGFIALLAAAIAAVRFLGGA